MAKAGLLFVGTDDGAVLFSNPNNIGRWLRIGQPFRGHAVRALWLLPDNPLVVLAAVEGMGLQCSDDGGQSWAAALEVEISAIAGDRTTPQLIYLSTPDGQVHRSDDAGASWVRCADGGWQPSRDARLVIARNDALTVYLGLSDGSIWVSPDGGASWAPFTAPLPAPVTELVESHLLPGVLYVLAGGALYQCDGESPRRRIATPGPAVSVATLAGKDPVLLLGQAGGVGRSADAGATWTMAESVGDWGGDVGVIAPAGYHIDTAFAGSVGGKLYTSTDRGRTWQMIKQDLPPIRSIASARLA
jgi:photosystem II stability/assembly factor-like uncharacterized protein